MNESKIVWIQTGEDEDWIFGKRMEGEVWLTDTVQLKPGRPLFDVEKHDNYLQSLDDSRWIVSPTIVGKIVKMVHDGYIARNTGRDLMDYYFALAIIRFGKFEQRHVDAIERYHPNVTE